MKIISQYISKKIILRCLSVSRRLASRLRYVVEEKAKKKENNFSIHKNLQNIRKKYKNKNPYESGEKRRATYKEKQKNVTTYKKKQASERAT